MIDLNNDLADDDDNNNKMKNVLKDIRLKAASRDRLLLLNNNNKNNKDEIEILTNEIGWLKTREFIEEDDSINFEYLPITKVNILQTCPILYLKQLLDMNG